jgi:hypothetical protein
MKKLVGLFLGLLLVSLACQAVLPPDPTASQLPATAQSKSTSPKETVSVSTPSVKAVLTSTPRPTPPPIACADDTCLNACLGRIANTVPQANYEALTGVYAGGNIELNLVYYAVKNGQLDKPQFLYAPEAFKVFQQDTVAHQNVWAYAAGLLPPADLKWITGFEIFKSSNYAAWVRPGGSDQTDRSRWTLGMEIVAAQTPVDLTYILVHEYGHLVTLNTDQIPASEYYYGWSQNAAVCPRFLSPDGCSAPDSYINLFYQQFWKNIYADWLKEVERPQAKSSDEFRALVENFYARRSGLFVRSYAATNIYEDMAESFMHFVLEPKPTDKSAIAQKIQFFYNFPELLALRQQMIQNICSYTGQ